LRFFSDPGPLFHHNRLLASYLMRRMLTLVLTELLELQFRRTFGYVNTGAIIPVTALATLQPDILPFTLFFSHKVRPNQAGLLTQEASDYGIGARLDTLSRCEHLRS